MLLLTALVVALAATPAPTPAPPNPFTLSPLAAPSTLPIIGTTKSRALCSAIRRAVAPAVAAAITSDKTYGGFRKTLYDYIVKDSDPARDLHLMQMDRTVQSMVKTVDDLETALNSHAFDVLPSSTQKDAEALTAIKSTLRGVLEAQKIQLDTMSGFVETERMSRFGRLDETQASMQRAIGPDSGSLANATPAPNHAFLKDRNQIYQNGVLGMISIDAARNLDHDLADIAAFTSKREDAASRAIIPATQLCK